MAKRNEISKKLADQTSQKVLRRLNGVSVTLWDIKLKDIFQVERSKKLVAKNLVRDDAGHEGENYYLNKRKVH